MIKNYMMRRRDRKAEQAIEFQARHNSSVPTPISTGLFGSLSRTIRTYIGNYKVWRLLEAKLRNILVQIKLVSNGSIN